MYVTQEIFRMTGLALSATSVSCSRNRSSLVDCVMEYLAVGDAKMRNFSHVITGFSALAGRLLLHSQVLVTCTCLCSALKAAARCVALGRVNTFTQSRTVQMIDYADEENLKFN